MITGQGVDIVNIQRISQAIERGGHAFLQRIYTEKEILGDALATQKCSTGQYNTAANECVHEDVRQTMLHILKQEHEIQQDVFCMMHEKGLYPTPEAEEKKVQQLKQQYQQCVK